MEFYSCFTEERLNFLEKQSVTIAPENLVFSGGGIKGLGYIGAIKALEEKNLTTGIKGYAGASAGAIMAGLLAIGIQAEELKKYMLELDYSLFLKRSNVNIEALAANPKRLLDPRIGGVVAFDELVHKGLCDGAYFRKWLIRMFSTKGFTAKTTYKELYEANGKVLKVVLCNLNYRKTVIASYKSTPKLPIIDSILASAAIPFVYWPFEWEGDLYIDGGTMYNYPIEIFDEEAPWEKTLGFLLTARKHVFKPKRKEDYNLWEHMVLLYEALMNVDNEYCFRMGNQKRTVFIDASGMDILEFSATKEKKEKLIQEGYNATLAYINGTL